MNTTPEALKKEVSEFYGSIARAETSIGCGPDNACCGVAHGASMSDSYEGKEGYVADADLGLGCGVPTEFADLQPGHTVLDLGSGAGNDAFVARAAVGVTGHVIGVDMTPDMLARARENAAKRSFNNVEFRLGEIEHLPVTSATVDRILSNCVLNLVPDKDAANREMYRVLKPGGKFSVSDIAMEGEVSPEIRSAAALYVGCVAGAVTRAAMTRSLESAGFTDVRMPKAVPYPLDAAMIKALLPAGVDADTLLKNVQVYKVTVTGTKPETSTGEKVALETSEVPAATPALKMVTTPAPEASCCGAGG
jgi:arsenite methyltransferase